MDKALGETPRMAMEFMFPYHMFPQGSRVVIYGAGNVGRLIYRQAVHDGYVKIVGIVDRNYEGMSAPDLPVKPVQDMLKMADLSKDELIAYLKARNCYMEALVEAQKKTRSVLEDILSSSKPRR